MEFFSNLISELLLKKEIINTEDFEIYKFGILISLYKIIFIFSVYVLCLVLEKSYILETTIFLITFFFIRQYSGGYHANSEKMCFLIFILIYIIFRLALKFIKLSPYLYLVLSILSSLFIYTKAPIDCKNKRLNSFEKVKYKQIVKTRLIITDLLILFLKIFSFDSILCSVVYAKISIFVLMRKE